MDIYCFGLKSFCGIENDFFSPKRSNLPPGGLSLGTFFFFNNFYISEKYIHSAAHNEKNGSCAPKSFSIPDSESVHLLSAAFSEAAESKDERSTGSAVICCCWYKEVSQHSGKRASVRMKEPLWCGASVLYSEHTGLNQCWTINLTIKTSNWILPYRILLSQCFHWQPRESSLTVWYRWSTVLSATPHRNVQVGVKPTFLLPRRRLRRHRRARDLPPRRTSQPRRSHPTRTPSVRPYKRQHSSLERTFPPRENVTVQCRKCQNAI